MSLWFLQLWLVYFHQRYKSCRLDNGRAIEYQDSYSVPQIFQVYDQLVYKVQEISHSNN